VLRPEGLGIGLAVVAASEALAHLRGPNLRASLARLLPAAGLPLVSQAVLEAVRFGVWGHLLPNSVYGVDAAIARNRRFKGYALAHVSSANCGYTLFAFRQSRTTR
jgi:hypothetical protein